MPSRPRPPSSEQRAPRPLSALTSVPVQFPGAGWTTIPAGLSTTSTSSSSKTTVERDVFAEDRPADRGGISTDDPLARPRSIARTFAPTVHDHPPVGDQRRGLIPRQSSCAATQKIEAAARRSGAIKICGVRRLVGRLPAHRRRSEPIAPVPRRRLGRRRRQRPSIFAPQDPRQHQRARRSPRSRRR